MGSGSASVVVVAAAADGESGDLAERVRSALPPRMDTNWRVVVTAGGDALLEMLECAPSGRPWLVVLDVRHPDAPAVQRALSQAEHGPGGRPRVVLLQPRMDGHHVLTNGLPFPVVLDMVFTSPFNLAEMRALVGRWAALDAPERGQEP